MIHMLFVKGSGKEWSNPAQRMCQNFNCNVQGADIGGR